MSLARIALRIAAVEAIKDQTLVGENVLDSPNGALDIQADGTLRTDEDRPFVSVYTDTGTADSITGRSLIENGSCVLVIESGISMAMTETNSETDVSEIVGVSIPPSDRAFEFYLDVVQRQVLDALSDPDNAWAEIYRSLHYSVTKVEIGGRRNTDDGQRLAGHQIRITLNLIDDPVRGEVEQEGQDEQEQADEEQALEGRALTHDLVGAGGDGGHRRGHGEAGFGEDLRRWEGLGEHGATRPACGDGDDERLSDRPGDGDDERGHQAGQGGGNHDSNDRLHLLGTDAVRGFAQRHRHRLEGILGDRRDERDGEDADADASD